MVWKGLYGCILCRDGHSVSVSEYSRDSSQSADFVQWGLYVAGAYHVSETLL
jgi:hypothetical protein